jgi:hypothetical protein
MLDLRWHARAEQGADNHSEHDRRPDRARQRDYHARHEARQQQATKT